jgi:transposase
MLGALDGVVARPARELVRPPAHTTDQRARSRAAATRSGLAPSLLAIPGCGILNAAMILGETAGVHRFRNKDAYARFTATAPIPVWSGSSRGKQPTSWRRPRPSRAGRPNMRRASFQ